MSPQTRPHFSRRGLPLLSRFLTPGEVMDGLTSSIARKPWPVAERSAAKNPAAWLGQLATPLRRRGLALVGRVPVRPVDDDESSQKKR